MRRAYVCLRVEAKVEATLVIHQKQELFVGDKRTSTSWSGGKDDDGACIPLGGSNRAQTDGLALAHAILMNFYRRDLECVQNVVNDDAIRGIGDV